MHTHWIRWADSQLSCGGPPRVTSPCGACGDGGCGCDGGDDGEGVGKILPCLWCCHPSTLSLCGPWSCSHTEIICKSEISSIIDH